MEFYEWSSEVGFEVLTPVVIKSLPSYLLADGFLLGIFFDSENEVHIFLRRFCCHRTT
jgi:hypothetical protein